MKKFLILCALFFGMAFPSQAKEMPLSRQETPFGQVHLISCTTALRTTGPIYLGVAVFPDPEWQVKNINLTPAASDNSPIQLFEPFEQSFETELVYPISAVLTKPSGNPVTFSVTGDITACNEEKCLTQPIHLVLTLAPQFALMTPKCGIITLALANTPIPMHMNALQGWAVREKSGQTHVTLDFERTPKTLKLYDSQKNPLDLNFFLHKKRLQFTWPTKENPIRFFVYTAHHYYAVELPILPPETAIPQFSSDIFWDALWAALAFLLLSALPIFWARITQVSPATFKKEAIEMAILAPYCALIMFFVLYFWGALPLNLMLLPKWLTLSLMALGLIFIPAHSSVALLLTLLAPKPYLANLTTFCEQTTFLASAAILTFLVFALQIKWTKPIFNMLQTRKSTSYIWWIVRLPWVFLMIYTFIYL